MKEPSENFYPMNMFHSRYGGTYSGGTYILIAGSYNPRKETQAVGSDPDCMSFWRRVELNGPILEIESGDDTKEIYVDSGSHPAVLYQKYYDFCKDRINENIAIVVTEVIRDYPEVEKSARDNIIDLHKLNLISKGRYGEQGGSGGVYSISSELVSRFPEYDSISSPKKLDDDQKEELKQFVDEIEEDLNIPLQYNWSI